MEPLRVAFVGCGEHARMSLYPSLRAAFGGSPAGLPALVLSQEGRSQPPLLARLVALVVSVFCLEVSLMSLPSMRTSSPTA